MVMYRDDTILLKYLAAYDGDWYDIKEDCDRCGTLCDDPLRKLSIERWISIAPRGARPFFCPDCARHYGLSW
jgi:hypothetical protein